MPSTSYANPAVTVAALFVTGPIALSTTTALIYVPAQIVGALIALLVIVTVYPRRFTSERPAVECLMAGRRLCHDTAGPNFSWLQVGAAGANSEKRGIALQTGVEALIVAARAWLAP